MRRLLAIAAAFALMLGLALAARWLAESTAGIGAVVQPREPVRAGYRDIGWPDLVPEGWEAMAAYRHLDLRRLDDDDPRAVALAERMRADWDNAPTRQSLDGASVRLSGYLVPLESEHGRVHQFLLVPHFGACIHTPPPAANQLVLVRLPTPAANLRTMDSVSVSGRLATTRSGSGMGTSGYTLTAVHLEHLNKERR